MRYPRSYPRNTSRSCAYRPDPSALYRKPLQCFAWDSSQESGEFLAYKRQPRRVSITSFFGRAFTDSRQECASRVHLRGPLGCSLCSFISSSAKSSLCCPPTGVYCLFNAPYIELRPFPASCTLSSMGASQDDLILTTFLKVFPRNGILSLGQIWKDQAKQEMRDSQVGMTMNETKNCKI